jgi:DNA-binding transcriptional ArsR family regulator
MFTSFSVSARDGMRLSAPRALSRELAELRQAVLVRLMEQRQSSDPFGFLVYAELAGAELSPVR